MEKKKETKGELERRIKNSVLLVPRDKDYISIYFDDKGLRLEVTQDFAVISTGFHRHVFNNITSTGVSRPWLYTKRFIEIALANDCMVKDEKGNVTRSYGKLFAKLGEKEDKSEHNICWYYDLWLNNIFSPLYGIGESTAESFLVYESYLHNIARHKVILSEKIDDITNVGFVKEVCDNELEFINDMEENVIFKKKTDEEAFNEEVAALREQEDEKELEKTN